MWPASRPRSTTATPPRLAVQSTVDLSQPPSRLPDAGSRHQAVPVFTAARSTEEEPGSAPAASPRLRRRPSAWPPRTRVPPAQEVPHPAGKCAPLPAHIHQVRAGLALRGVTTPVPRVLLSITLAGPTPSGGPDAPRLCQGCSHPPRHLPAQAAPSFSGPLRRPAGAGLSPPLEPQRLTAHEARPERLRHHLRRPYPPQRPQLTPTASYTVHRTLPSGLWLCVVGSFVTEQLLGRRK